jgi:hypothetical protein
MNVGPLLFTLKNCTSMSISQYDLHLLSATRYWIFNTFEAIFYDWRAGPPLTTSGRCCFIIILINMELKFQLSKVLIAFPETRFFYCYYLQLDHAQLRIKIASLSCNSIFKTNYRYIISSSIMSWDLTHRRVWHVTIGCSKNDSSPVNRRSDQFRCEERIIYHISLSWGTHTELNAENLQEIHPRRYRTILKRAWNELCGSVCGVNFA